MSLPDVPEQTSRTRISVALCTHNGAAFVQEQMQSICAQDLLPAQIVISDDASTDDSVSLAEAVVHNRQLSQPHISLDLHVFRNDAPLMVTKNFEQAVKACDGELIVLSDQDDIWHINRLSRMTVEFERRPDLILMHGDARLIDQDGNRLPLSLFRALEVRPFELKWIHQGRALDVFLRRNLAAGTTVMFRRSLLQYALPFPPEWLHDEWLAVIAAALEGVDVMECALVDYRQHASNQVGVRRETLLAKIRKAFAVRDDTLARRARKAEILLQRLTLLGDAVPPECLAKVRGKVAHQRFRAALPVQRWRRWGAVLREVLAGRYTQYGRMPHSLARDLLESGDLIPEDVERLVD